MITEVSRKALKRSPVKTVLLGILIALATVFLCLGVGMYTNSVDLLKQADETYTTLALIEYTAGNYPNEALMTKTAKEKINELDINQLQNQEGVLEVQTLDLMRANIEGAQVTAAFEPLFLNQCIIEFKVLYVTKDGQYRCTVNATRYGKKDFAGSTFGISSEAGDVMKNVTLKAGHSYVAVGDFREDNYLKVFCPVAEFGYVNEQGSSSGIEGFPITDITGKEDYFNSPEGKKWEGVCRTVQITNDSFLTMAVDGLETYRDFYLGSQELTEGRYWTEQEEEQGARVCVMEKQMARVLGIKLGDRIKANLFCSEEQEKFNDGYNPEEGFLDSGEYQVVGIYENKESDKIHTLFLPKTSVASLPKNQVHYNVATVVLKNGFIDEYLKAIEPYVKKNFRVKTYDQGYEQTVTPIYAMKRNSVLIVILCLISVGAVLLLFTNLFVVKQQEAIGIMNALGTGKKRIRGYLLHGAAVIGGAGVVLGGMAGYLTTGVVAEKAYEIAKETFSRDLRFSSLTMGAQKFFEGRVAVSAPLTIAIILVMAVGILLLTYGSANRMIRDTANFGGQIKKKKRHQKENLVEASAISKETFHFRETAFVRRYTGVRRVGFLLKESFRSIRCNKRSGILLFMVTVALSAFMIFYTREIQSQKEELPRIYKEAKIDAYFTNVSGRPLSTSRVPEQALKIMSQSKNKDKIFMSYSDRYEFVGSVDEKEGTKECREELDKLDFQALDKETEFRARDLIAELEHRMAVLNEAAQLITTRDIRRTPEFFLASPPVVTYLKGYETTLRDGRGYQEKFEEKLVSPAVVTEDFLQEHSMKLGDIFMVSHYLFVDEGQNYWYNTRAFKAVGTYQSAIGENNIYTGQQDTRRAFFMATGRRGTLSMMGNVPEAVPFTNYILNDVKHLGKLKDDLEAEGITGVGTVGDARVSIIFDDKELVQTTSTLENNIQFMTTLRYVLFFFVLLMGFVISYMTIKARKPEFAIMRSLGTGTARTFLMFFLEQLFITIAGLAAGILGCSIYLGKLTKVELFSVLLFLGIFVIGSAFSIGRMNRKNVLRILSDKE